MTIISIIAANVVVGASVGAAAFACRGLAEMGAAPGIVVFVIVSFAWLLFWPVGAIATVALAVYGCIEAASGPSDADGVAEIARMNAAARRYNAARAAERN